LQEKYQTIIKNSEEEANFISDLTKVIENIDILHIPNKDSLKVIVQEYTRFPNSSGTNTHTVSILLNTPKHGEMRSIRTN